MAGASRGRARIVAPLLLLGVTLVAPFLGQPPADAQTSSLGAGLTVLPTDDGTEADLGGNNRLWFNVAPGGTASRRFTLSSQSDLTQQVTFEMLNMLVVDGTPRIDPSGPTPLTDWVRFSPERVDLEPRGSVEVTMTVGVPEGIASEAQRGYLRVLVGAVDAGRGAGSPSGTTAQVGNILAFAQDVWVGVGGADGALLVTDFEIDGVQGILEPGSEDKALRLRFRNIGETPLGLEGTVELRSLDFEDLRIGPLDFNTSEILPGARGFVDVPLDPTTVEGDWQILIRAQQGQIVRTEVLEERLEFLIPGTSSPLRALAIRGALFLLGLLTLVMSIRLLRRSSTSRGGRPTEATVDLVPEVEPVETPLGASSALVRPLGRLGAIKGARARTAELRPLRRRRGDGAAEPPPEPSGAAQEPRPLRVHVLGAVQSPSLVTLPADSRIGDAIAAAGGPTPDADVTSMNLARWVWDGQQLHVPSLAHAPASDAAAGAPRRTLRLGVSLADLNRATVEQLADVPGMTRRVAEEIVAYRRSNGDFASVEELRSVNGIGPKRFAAVRGFVRVDGRVLASASSGPGAADSPDQ